MMFPTPIFAVCKRRIYLSKIVRIPQRGYSKQQVYLSFAISLRDAKIFLLISIAQSARIIQGTV